MTFKYSFYIGGYNSKVRVLKRDNFGTINLVSHVLKLVSVEYFESFKAVFELSKGSFRVAISLVVNFSVGSIVNSQNKINSST